MSINSDTSQVQANTPATEVESLRRLVEEQRKLIDKFTNQLIDRCQEKCIFIEAPGSKKLDRTSFIKADSQSYQSLQTLALQSELHQPITIREADYKFTPRTTKETSDIDADIDTRSRSVRCAESIADFAYEYSDSGKHLSDGVQIEYRPNHPPASNKTSPKPTSPHQILSSLPILVPRGTASRNENRALFNG
jgi:hypothetical protein